MASDPQRDELLRKLVGCWLNDVTFGESLVRFGFEEPEVSLVLHRWPEVRRQGGVFVREDRGYADEVVALCGARVVDAGEGDGPWLHVSFDRDVTVAVALDGGYEDMASYDVAVMRGEDWPAVGVWVVDGVGPPSSSRR